MPDEDSFRAEEQSVGDTSPVNRDVKEPFHHKSIMDLSGIGPEEPSTGRLTVPLELKSNATIPSQSSQVVS